MLRTAALLGVSIAAAMIGIAAPAPVLAQQLAQCWPTDIYGAEENGTLDGSFGKQTFQVRACAHGEVLVDQGSIPTVVETPPDPFDPESGFRMLFDVEPCGLGGGSDLPGAELTVKFVSELPEANASAVMVLAPDKDKPTLTTTSQPTNGTKVKPGDIIKIKMQASEEYNNPRYNWQTGVKKVQLTDESRNQIVPPHFEGAEMRPCAEKQWKQMLEVTYTVPSNPPPIIRLRAVAEDFAGNQDFDVGEFPTGDWYGTFNWNHDCEGGMTDKTKGISDLALDYDGQGNLTGTLAGSIPDRVQVIQGCSVTFLAPGSFSARLVGSYTPGPGAFSAASRRCSDHARPGLLHLLCGEQCLRGTFLHAVRGPDVPGVVSRSAPPGRRRFEIKRRNQFFSRRRVVHDQLFADAAKRPELTASRGPAGCQKNRREEIVMAK